MELITAVSDCVSVPVVVSGGAGNADHVTTMISQTGCEAAASASIFHYDICAVADVKTALSAAGHEVRP